MSTFFGRVDGGFCLGATMPDKKSSTGFRVTIVYEKHGGDAGNSKWTTCDALGGGRGVRYDAVDLACPKA